MSPDAVQRTPPPDLADHTVYFDWWASLQDAEAWEKLRLECEAETRAKRETKP